MTDPALQPPIAPERRAALASALAANRAKPVSAIRPRPSAAHIPITAGQHALWLITQLTEGRRAYNHLVAYTIDGPFDAARFERAAAHLVARPEALRTVYPSDGRGVPLGR